MKILGVLPLLSTSLPWMRLYTFAILSPMAFDLVLDRPYRQFGGLRILTLEPPVENSWFSLERVRHCKSSMSPCPWTQHIMAWAAFEQRLLDHESHTLTITTYHNFYPHVYGSTNVFFMKTFIHVRRLNEDNSWNTSCLQYTCIVFVNYMYTVWLTLFLFWTIFQVKHQVSWIDRVFLLKVFQVRV